MGSVIKLQYFRLNLRMRSKLDSVFYLGRYHDAKFDSTKDYTSPFLQERIFVLKQVMSSLIILPMFPFSGPVFAKHSPITSEATNVLRLSSAILEGRISQLRRYVLFNIWL